MLSPTDDRHILPRERPYGSPIPDAPGEIHVGLWTAAYAAAAAAWVIAGDFIQRSLAPEAAIPFDTWKDLAFVLATTVVLFTLLGRLRQRLAAQQRRLWLLTGLASKSSDVLVLEDAAGRIVEINERSSEIYGRSREELIGCTMADLRTPAARALRAADREPLARTGEAVFVTEHQAASGARFEVEVSARTVEIGGERYVHSTIRDITRFWREHEWLRLYFDLPFLGMAVSSAVTRRWIRFNDEFCRMLGYRREELEKLTWADLTHPDDVAANVREFDRVVAGETDGYRLLKRYVRADGSYLHADLEVRCVRSPDGRAQYLLATVHDVTERHLAELRLTRARDLNAMLSQTNAAVARADDERTLLSEICRIAVGSGHFRCATAHIRPGTDDSAPTESVEYPCDGPGCALTHAPSRGDDPCSLAIAAGHRIEWTDLDVAAERPAWMAFAQARGVRSVIAEPLRNGERIAGALSLCAGEPGFFADDVKATLDEVLRSVSFGLYSLALRRERELAVRAQEEVHRRLRAIVDASPSAIWLLDLDGRFLLANERCSEWLGIPQAQLLGAARDDVLPRTVADEQVAHDHEVLETGRAISVMEILPRPGGERVVLSVKFPVRDVAGRMHAIGAVATDISDSRRIADEVRALNDRWASLIEASPAAIFDVDAHGSVRSVWNRAAEEFYGVPAELAIGRALPMLRPPEAVAHQVWHRALKGETVRGVPLTRARSDGSVLHVTASAAPLRNARGRVDAVLFVLVDVSDRVRAEVALVASERNYRMLFDRNPNPMWVYEVDGRRILAVNDAAVDTYGYAHEEFLRMRIDDLRPTDALPKFLERFDPTAEGIRRSGNWRHRRKDGSELDVEIVSHSLSFDGRRARLVLANDVTERLRATTALQQSEANLRRLNVELEDRIRDRTRELSEAKDRAEAADRVKSVFLGTVSHELRTPLNSIIGFTDLLLTETTERWNKDQRKQLGIVHAAGRQLLAVISDFLDISKIEAGVINLRSGAVRLPGDLRYEVDACRTTASKRGLDFAIRAPADDVVVVADLQRVKQVLSNLLSNAVKFTDAGGITLTVEQQDGECRVSVDDTGIGVPEEHLASIFEPFKRIESSVERDREGTGLGLAIAQRLTHAMGGRIGADSTSGRGSRFWFTLPLAPLEILDGRPADRG